MSPEDFAAAKVLEDDGWECRGFDDAGNMMFSRILFGVTYSADVRIDR